MKPSLLCALALALLALPIAAPAQPANPPANPPASGSVHPLRAPGTFLRGIGRFLFGGERPSVEKRRQIARREARSVAETSRRRATWRATHHHHHH